MLDIPQQHTGDMILDMPSQHSRGFMLASDANIFGRQVSSLLSLFAPETSSTNVTM